MSEQPRIARVTRQEILGITSRHSEHTPGMYELFLIGTALLDNGTEQTVYASHLSGGWPGKPCKWQFKKPYGWPGQRPNFGYDDERWLAEGGVAPDNLDELRERMKRSGR